MQGKMSPRNRKTPGVAAPEVFCAAWTLSSFLLIDIIAHINGYFKYSPAAKYYSSMVSSV